MSGLPNQNVRSQRTLPFDRLLSHHKLFDIDEIACRASANIIRSVNRASHQAPEQKSILFLLALSAICHQMNWDFLSGRLKAYFSAHAVDAVALSKVTARDIIEILGDYHRPERIRAAERANLLRDLGAEIISRYDNDPEGLIAAAKGHLYGSAGLMTLLDHFEAFREDPLRKKSNVLIHEVVRQKVGRFEDEAQIAPAVDYHIMRLYLRTGRVVPVHAATLMLLQSNSAPRQRLVKLLREGVSEALSLTAFYTGMSVPEVNTFEWQIGRQICDRVHPECQEVKEAVPGTNIGPGQTCPNASFCRAFHDAAWRSLREPDLKKRFY